MFSKKENLNIFEKVTESTRATVYFLLKMRLPQRRCPVNFAIQLQNNSRQLLLNDNAGTMIAQLLKVPQILHLANYWT